MKDVVLILVNIVLIKCIVNLNTATRGNGKRRVRMLQSTCKTINSRNGSKFQSFYEMIVLLDFSPIRSENVRLLTCIHWCVLYLCLNLL